ncbi:hypothetical protein ANCDUO_08123 [Ancylostoma duodenale]|uniref:Reverse transcriptase domain-containing protein n=1 Tax=Ancylostoma duodenale TaxID=51022 RepID=A0A0C2DGM6_9BILA|nr:hypothetical protein ANCDUO_08123 [Ancylostoma duodenale]
MEIEMLRWMAGIERLDHIWNEDIRQHFGVAPITDKLRETRLRWFGHVLCADSDSVCKIGFRLCVTGQATERKREAKMDGHFARRSENSRYTPGPSTQQDKMVSRDQQD